MYKKNQKIRANVNIFVFWGQVHDLGEKIK